MIDTGWHCDFTVIVGELDRVRVVRDDIVSATPPHMISEHVGVRAFSR
jgi:hypothetical protein